MKTANVLHVFKIFLIDLRRQASVTARGTSAGAQTLKLRWAALAVGCGCSCSMASGILGPQPGIKHRVPSITRPILNHWTARGSAWVMYILALFKKERKEKRSKPAGRVWPWCLLNKGFGT